MASAAIQSGVSLWSRSGESGPVSELSSEELALCRDLVRLFQSRRTAGKNLRCFPLQASQRHSFKTGRTSHRLSVDFGSRASHDVWTGIGLCRCRTLQRGGRRRQAIRLRVSVTAVTVAQTAPTRPVCHSFSELVRAPTLEQRKPPRLPAPCPRHSGRKELSRSAPLPIRKEFALPLVLAMSVPPDRLTHSRLGRSPRPEQPAPCPAPTPCRLCALSEPRRCPAAQSRPTHTPSRNRMRRCRGPPRR